MKKLLSLLLCGSMLLGCSQSNDELNKTDEPGNGSKPIVTSIIYYTTSDGKTITPNMNNIVENVYENGQGVITIADQVTEIGKNAFRDCDNLTGITLPESLTSIGDGAFSGCNSLSNVYCKPTTPPTLGSSVFSSSATIYVPWASVDDYKSASGWSDYAEKIAGYDFDRDMPVYTIYYTTSDGKTIAPNMDNIVENMYENGQGVITIASLVTEIVESAFRDCDNLTGITLPESLTAIGDGAFSGCNSLSNVYCKPTTPPTLGSSVFPGSATILVPWTSVDAYESANGWSGYAEKITGYDFNSDIPVYTIYYTTSDEKTISPNLDNIIENVYKNGQGIITFAGPVTEIGEGAFSDCDNLASITLPESVTTIDDSAFSGCSSLTSITFPESLTKIGAQAFYACINLTSIDLPGSLTLIGDQAFRSCSSLKNITFPESLKTIGTYAFYQCNNLTNITFPESLKTIGTYAFYSSDNMSIYCKPTTPPTLGSSAFPRSATIYVPWASVNAYKSSSGWSYYTKKIAGYDFNTDKQSNIFYYTSTDGTALSNVRLSSFAVDLVSNTYVDGQGMLTFSGAITTIGGYAFRNCSNLASITLPEGVTTIGSYAFYDCSEVVSITLPESLVSISDNAFCDCSSLTNITIPDGVTSIGGGAFYSCSSLTNITIPDGVTTIEKYAFYSCGSLTNITIPDGVTAIEKYAFYSCSSFTNITIPDGVTTIEDYAFADCNSLASIYCKPTTPPTSVSSAFPWSATIYVPWASVNVYKSATGWKNIVRYDYNNDMQDFAIYYTTTDGIAITPKMDRVVENRYENGQGIIWLDNSTISNVFKDCTNLASITIPKGFTAIGVSAFQNCSSLTNITIPDGVTTIGSYAFYGCSSLTNITIPDGVTTIGRYAFYDCSSLTSITLPESLTSIGLYAFCNCYGLISFSGKYASSDHRCLIMNGELVALAPSGLTAYTIPDGVTSIESYVFSNCNLESITLPESMERIGAYAFCDWRSLKSITLPKSLKSIDSYAFCNCVSLKSITLPEGVTTIGTYIFSSCNSLTTITLPESLEIIGDYAFYNCSFLNSITIPKGVTKIGVSPFERCSRLKIIYCRPLTPPSLSWDLGLAYPLFYDIHVPRGSFDAYTSANGWKTYAYIIIGDL